MEDIENISIQIENIHSYFSDYANRQVNYAYTLRNWLIGMYLFQIEQKGKERAEYGEKIYKNLAKKLKEKNIKGMSFMMLHSFKNFFLTYPSIVQLVTEQFQNFENEKLVIIQSMIGEFNLEKKAIRHSVIEELRSREEVKSIAVENPGLFISKISFTHILEFIKIENALQRSFYEIQTVKNNWTVRQLQREVNSLLYERIGLSTNKGVLLDKLKNDHFSTFSDIVKNPYILEFLNIPEISSYSENDLEQSIINHLQQFLIELGRGFCFEARQKRISFNNKHYRIDLVFYHRILKCHILIDLKIGEFDHSDAGQMNLYLNYFKENEMAENDNPPIGIILCSQRDAALVHYATGGLSQEVFVSKYKLQLPTEEELKELIKSDVESFQNSD
ncbi:PDDEXK nuclease domain-containing protein [Flavobacterium sp.]|uniref:PDDEXK nuclease domain-containing protein n=1 Tax=Flavobacterium sp. TaxID=239 RepID=UPI002603BE37|nr:PDDEXK nuclease domain-containing protein [Flavobacterium sp.]